MKILFTFLFVVLLFSACEKENTCDGGTLRLSNTSELPVTVFMDETVTIQPGDYADFQIDFQYSVLYRFEGGENQEIIVQVEPCTILKIGLTD